MIIEVKGDSISEEEKRAYIDHVRSKAGRVDIQKIVIDIDGDFVNLEWHTNPIPFDRIRRITGYLVGTLDRFNDGKRAEEADRVHHGFDDDYYQRYESGLTEEG